MDVYDRIDAALKEKHMSRRQLAQKAGINTSSFATAFSRRSHMTPENLEKIAKALEKSPADLDPRYKCIAELVHIAEKEMAYTEEQLTQVAYISLIAQEFEDDGFFEKLSNAPKRADLYRIAAAAFALNKVGREKAEQFLFDLNKIPEYREAACAVFANAFTKQIEKSEVVSCPEDAPPTAAALSPVSGLTDAGK